jgi:hypothetical protein
LRKQPDRCNQSQRREREQPKVESVAMIHHEWKGKQFRKASQEDLNAVHDRIQCVFAFFEYLNFLLSFLIVLRLMGYDWYHYIFFKKLTVNVTKPLFGFC